MTGKFFKASRERLDLLREKRREEGMEGVASIPRRDDPSVHPLSFAQERLWFLDRFDPENPAYIIPSSIRLRGKLDVPALERALTEVVRRHEVLRATFHEEDGRPVQRISPPAPVRLETEGKPIRLEEGPLLRARLLRLGEDDHVLSLDVHHIAADGWSLGVLIRELTALYAGETLPELTIQYADYAAWQRERLAGDEQIDWWRERLAGAPPSLDLPFDRPRPAVRTFKGGHAERVLPVSLIDRLRALAGGEGASLFMVLLAGFQLLLSRWSGQEDIPVGSPIAGRTRREVEGLVGIFLNHLVLRTDLSGDPTFRELLGRVREVAVGAFAHQDLPFEKLLAEIEPQRDLSRTPLFQVFFNLLNFPSTELRLPGLTVEPLGVPDTQAKFDMTLYLVEEGRAVRLNLVYNADLFDAPRMEEALAQYHLLLEQAVADPDARIETFSLVTEAARRVLPDPEAPQDDSWPGPVSEAVLRHAKQTPDRPAVMWEGGQLTYAQLAEEMERVAERVEESVVAIRGHRSAPLVSKILGVMRAGAAFVILDPGYPEERNKAILDALGPSPPRSPSPTRTHTRPGEGEEESWDLATPPSPGGQGVRVGEGGRGGEGLAYIAFTSGSTGVPKGVLGLHRSLTHFYPWMSEHFQLGPDDRFSLLSGLSHDPLHRDVLTPLWLGGAVVIPDPERMGEPGCLSAWMARMGVTVAHLTPAMGRLLTSSPATPMPALRRAFFVGDVLTRRDVDRLRALAPNVQVVNLYGSTETQRAVGFHEVREDEDRYPLGRGMPDVQLLVLHSGRLCGIGEVGEIAVRSPHIALGYLHGERFGNLYRTGDLGRYLPNGEVEPLGRADFQVKIRGFRVELGEVEAALTRHPQIREAVVLAKGEGDDRRLVAYVVPPVEDDLRTFLRARLPEYMVPSAFVFLDALPLTPNRKVDRKALPEPEREEAEASFLSPREEILAGIWSEVLGIDRIGPDDDFFSLGGHSLKVTQILARVRDTFGVELPVRSLFESPTLSGLAARIAEASTPAAPRLVRVPRDGDLPLSFAQERLWFLHRFAPESPAYNMAVALRLSGDLDPSALERVLNEIVRRHESLRTTFPEVSGEPRQRIQPYLPFALPVIEVPEPEKFIREEAARPFDLRSGPLFRAVLLRLDEREWIAFFCLHHVVSDGWSMGVLVREVAELYTGNTLPELSIQYADFAVWQRNWLQLSEQIAWWREALADAPAVIDLPLDRPRSAGSGPAGHRSAFFSVPRHPGVTLFMVLLAAFQALLHRLTGQDDVVVGTPIANRTHAGLENLIGFFVNTLALRSRVEGDPTFRELLASARATALEAYARQDLPFEKLVEELRVERSLHHAPVFQVMLVLQNAPMADLELPGLTLSPVPLAPGAAKFDLSLTLLEDGRATLEYDAHLFDEATAERLLERLGALMEGIDPDLRLSDLPVMGEAERRQVESGLREPELSVDAPVPIHRRFEELAARTPAALAIGLESRGLDYDGLDRAANRLAHALRAAGAGIEIRVAVSVQRSEGWALGFLAVLKAGAVYVPLDPRLPAERLELLLADSGARVLLTEEPLLARLPSGLRTVLLDAAGPEMPPSVHFHPGALAYVIYTSGSTGVPKGVGVPHGPLARHVAEIARRYGLGPGDRLLGAHADGFDVSIEQMLAPLASGAALYPRSGELWSAAEVAERIERWGITVAMMPTAYWRQLATDLAASGRTLGSLRLAEVIGEAMPLEAARRWLAVAPGARLLNGYGPTETVITPTVYELEGEVRPTPSGSVPIGRPVAGRTARVVDRHGRAVPIGVAGELLLGGPMARGYLGRPDLTAAAFVPNPDPGAGPGARLYRTGDRVRLRADGHLEFLERLDHQVKIRGFRVELGEIEAALVSNPGVREAVAGIRGERLVAWVAPAIEDDLRSFLRACLPEYMVPSAFVFLDELPLTPNRKVDRKSLPEPVRKEAEASPLSPTEELLAAIWSEVLRVDRIGPDDDFFALGGHSLKVIQAVARVREAFGVELPVRGLFESPTLSGLAARIEEASRSTAPPLVPAPRDGDLPLSFAQERLWFLHRLAPESPAYNMPVALRLSGDLDTAALEKSLNEIVRRHESLRTTFPEVDGEPRQRIHPYQPFSLPVIEVPEPERFIREEAARPFDLRNGPLFRAFLFRDQEWMAFFCLHHVISDGWSMGVLVREVAELYTGKMLPELSIQYADFAVWQRGSLQLSDQIAWWREELAEAPAVIDLPLDRPRAAGSGPAGHRSAFFPVPRHQGVTLFMFLLAAFQALLHRLTGQDDIVVGTPIANRTHAGLEKLIGLFVNTLALRSRVEGDPTFRELLASVRATALGAYAHQDLPFEKLVEELRVERSLHHAPVFQVMLALQNAPIPDLELPGLTLSPIPLASGVAKFELSLSFQEDGRAKLEYDTRLFDEATAERLLERFGVLLEGIDPDRRLSELPVMSEAERLQLFDQSVPEPADLVHRRFEEWAARTPGAMAVGNLTYAELNRTANRLARDLRAAGAGPETRVAVSTNGLWAVALLAVLKAGAAYVPLDPKLPAERLSLMLADSEASIFLADEALLDRAEGLRAICLDRVSRFGPDTFPPVEVHPESLAYVIYTSGSTGVPKPVGVSHGTLAWHLSGFCRRLGLGPGDRLLGAHADGFDVSVEQMLAPLVSGAAFFPRGGELWSIPELLERIERWGITVVEMPTAYWKQLVPSPPSPLPSPSPPPGEGRPLPSSFPLSRWVGGDGRGGQGVRGLRLVAGGEAMPVELARQWPSTVRLFNGYGPTETVITPTLYEVIEVWDTPSGTVPIGTLLPGRSARVVDRHGQPVPLGVAGELWLGGILARGYLGRPDATAERFVPAEGGERFYRTGDRVRRMADGNLEYLGRLDRQVKVRGYRIEPGEVEAALLRDPGVKEAAVLADGERLVAFLVPRSEPVNPELKLPAYMIPSAYVWLEALPLTPTGKVDRRALSRLEVRKESASVPPRNELERELAAIWEDLLGVPVGVTDDFFALGGHSLLAVRLASRIEARFGRPMPIATLFERRTIEALAASLPRVSSPLVRIQPGGSRPPLFMVHPGGGGVLCYADLARALGPDQPLYGLHSAGLDGERPPLDRIEEMAELYIGALPDGPVHLGGWSFGGLVVYEMACRLGERARLVAILDVAPREESEEDEAELLLRGLDEELPLTADELRGLDTPAQVALALQRMPNLPPDFDERRAVALVEVFKANLRAARVWEPRPYPGRVTLFRAAESSHLGPDGTGGWGPFAGDLEVVTVPGDHRNMVKPPHVEALARALREAMD